MNQGGEVNVTEVGIVVFVLYIVIFSLIVLLFRKIMLRRRRKRRQALEAPIEQQDREPEPSTTTPIKQQDREPEPSTTTPINNEPKPFIPRMEYVTVPQHHAQHKTLSDTERNKYKYVKRTYMMTRNERIFYRKLFAIVGRECLIFPQVHLSSLFYHDKHYQNYRGALSVIQRKSVDYVLCDANLKILGAIELDDSSHNRPERQERDRFVNKLFSDTGLPLVRIPLSNIDNDEQLHKLVRQCLNHSTQLVDPTAHSIGRMYSQ